MQQYYPNDMYSNLIFGDSPERFQNIRRNERFIARICAQAEIAGHFTHERDIKVLDFSEHGLKIETTLELPDELNLRIAVGPFHSAYVSPRIRRREAAVYGLEITREDEVWREFISEMRSAFLQDAA